MFRIEETDIEGCLKVFGTFHKDDRGANKKLFQMSELDQLGLESVYKEDLFSISNQNVLRGMHYQEKPYEQIKIIHCLKGKALDILLDIRTDSATFGRAQSFLLSGEDAYSLYVPAGIAHGYLSLVDDTIICYKMSSEYSRIYEGGIRWDSFGFEWGTFDFIMSERDKSFQTFEEYKAKKCGNSK